MIFDKIVIRWATEHGVPARAAWALIEKLSAEMEPEVESYPGCPDKFKETGVSKVVRLDASRRGARYWRNNVGAFKPETGGFVRYGLCNESKKMNDVLKSSDLIGIEPILITPEHVGTTIGQFACRETKKPGWRYRGTAREMAQNNFIFLVNSLGGDGKFCTGVDE